MARIERLIVAQFEDAAGALLPLKAAIAAPTPERAAKLVADGRRLRQTGREIDLELVMLTARQAPVACDLRLIVTMIQLVQHGGLIANQFALIGEQLLEVEPRFDAGGETATPLASMVEHAAAQLRDAAHSFAELDLDLAARVQAQDDELDRLNREVCRTALALDASAPRRALALRHVLIARSLERVGDNAVGIAAQTRFLVADDLHGLATTPRTLSA